LKPRDPWPFVPILLSAAFFFSLAVGSINYAMIFYLKDWFHADKGVIGLTAAGQTLVYIASMLLLLRGRTPRYRAIILFALGWPPVCIAVYLLVPMLGTTMLFHGLFGLAMTFFWPRVAGWLSSGLEGKVLGRVMGQYNMAWSSGGLIAPILGGTLVAIDPRLPFLIGGALLLAVFGFVFTGLRTPGPKTEPTPDQGSPGPGKTPLRFPARLGMVSISFLLGGLLNIYPAYAKDTFHLNEGLIGTFLMARMAFNALGFLIWSRLSFWHFQPWAALAVQALILALTLVFPLAGHPVTVFLLFGVAGLLFSFQFSYSQFHSNAGHPDRIRATTIHEVVLNVGMILGTALGGWVSEAFSMATVFALATVVTVGIAGVQVVLLGPRLVRGKAFCMAEVLRTPGSSGSPG